MQILKKDKFVTKLIGYNSFISFNKFDQKRVEKVKSPFFITIKSKKKIKIKKKSNKYKIFLNSKLVNFVRDNRTKYSLDIKCRAAKNKDKLKLIKIANEKHDKSRFFRDKNLPKKFKNKLRKSWILNYFKKKRGDFLIVAIINNVIAGFILLIKKKPFLRIDLIQTSKKFQKKGVAKSLINFANNNLLKKKYKMIAGTQEDNMAAIKMYKTLGFKKYGSSIYIYHLHNTF